MEGGRVLLEGRTSDGVEEAEKGLLDGRDTSTREDPGDPGLDSEGWWSRVGTRVRGGVVSRVEPGSRAGPVVPRGTATDPTSSSRGWKGVEGHLVPWEAEKGDGGPEGPPEDRCTFLRPVCDGRGEMRDEASLRPSSEFPVVSRRRGF